MGKGTKKKTVWRTFSFENGYTNGNDAATVTVNAADTANGFTTVLHHHHHHHHQHHHQKNENGNHDVTNRSSIPNGKLINSWRNRCTDDDLVDNDADVDNDDGDRTDGNDESKLHHHHYHHHHTNDGGGGGSNGNGVMNGYGTENGGGGGHRSYFRRSTNSDNLHKYPLRMNGLRKSSAYFQENGGTRSEFHDMYENSTPHNQFRSNRSSKGPPSTSRYANYRKWDNRNGSFSINGTASSNYSRGFRKSHFVHSDEAMAITTAAATGQQQQPTESATAPSNEVINQTDEHFHEAKNARNAGDSDKCHDNTNNGDGNSAQQLYDQTDKRRGKQQNKFNEDEYTRISTPRSEVLFKKGYLMRDKKYVGPTNTISTAPTTTTSSSNDSGSVSVISNEETASYYSIQSMSPDDSNSTYLNGGNSSSTDSNSATYPNDGFEHDLSFIYSSGFYDNSGYFYVNPYIHNNFDQFNGPTILMPYGSAPTTTPTATTKDADVYDTDGYPQASLSPGTADGKSIDSEQANNFSSINSEEMSNSSLSINNDLDTPPNPLTPPPSPLSPNEKPIASAQLSDSESPDESHENDGDEPDNDDSQNTVAAPAAPDGEEKITESIADAEHEEVPDADADAIISTDNYSMPYFSPLIFVPPIPFVPDARLANSRRGRFRRHLNNQYGRSKRNNRFTHFYNKVYIPSNWSEAPDEASSSNANADNAIESNDGKPVDGTPTIEQCDTILKNSKLNLNVSEFIPQSKRMILVPLSIASSPPTSLYFVPIPSTESTLNVNVPEFLPKNYKPLNERMEENAQYPNAGKMNKENDKHNDENDNNDNNNRNDELTTSSTVINGDDAITFTNEQSEMNEKNNETTINHKLNDLSNDHPKQMEYTPLKIMTTPTTTKKGAAVEFASTNGVTQSHTMTIRKANVTIRQNKAAAPAMSDLLKTNNTDNFNLEDDNDDDDAAAADAACSFNKENNSHTNLKADLGNKKIITYNNSKKVYKNDNHYSDSGSNHKGHKLNHISNNHHNSNNNNRNAKTRNAYPKTKETSHKRQELEQGPEQQQQKTLDRPVDDDVGDQKLSEHVSKSPEKSSRTYAQMVVPVAAKVPSTTTTAASMIKTPSPKTIDSKSQANGMVKTPKLLSSPSLSPSLSRGKINSSNVNRSKTNHPSKRRNSSNNNNNNNITKKDDTKRKQSADIVEKPPINDGSVEWFTIDAKGKKHAAPNGSTVTDIAFENIESNIEKVNKIAEELLLDINKDADLAMDIMDSLTVQTDPKSIETKTKISAKKKKPPVSTNKLKKKSTKEKLNKEQQQKRRDTFDIIEPNFGTNKTIESQSIDNNEAEDIERNDTDTEENNIIENGDSELDESLITGHDDDDDGKELSFDANMFATPCNLQHSPTIVGPTALSKSSLLLSSGGKSVRNLFNSFNIYQPDFASYENQQLKQEEEMVIKVLQQLNNKSMETSEVMESDKMKVLSVPDVAATVMATAEVTPPPNAIVSTKSDDELTSMREDSVERFAINAKPHQNVYSSNHFLEHFFGDRNDKCDHVVDSVSSTSLSSSDQPEFVDENVVDDQTVDVEQENFNTEPTIDANICNEMSIIKLNANENIELNTQNEHDEVYEFNDENNTNNGIECESNQSDVETNGKIESAEILETQNGKTEFDDIDGKRFVDGVESKIECMQDIHTELHSADEFIHSTQIEITTIPIENDCTPAGSNGTSNESVECDTEMPAIDQEKLDKSEFISIELKTEACSIEPTEPESEAAMSCNQSVKSNSSNNGQPWLRIVDTQMLEQQKKVPQTFPITSAVSMWLQAQKEKTPEPLLRIPNYRTLLTSAAAASAAGTKRTKIDSQTSHSNSSIDLTEDTASITSDKFQINDDEEEDIMNFWELPILPQSPTPPPIYNSVYGTSINYTNLLSNKNELLCNNIVDFDQIDVTAAAAVAVATDTNITNDKASTQLQNGFNQNAADTMNGKISGTDEKCYRPPPEVCCTIM